MHLIYDTSTTFFHSGWNRVIIKSEYYAFEESFHQLETRLFPIFLSPHITFLRNIYVYLKELNLHRFNCIIAALYPFFEILRKSFKFQRVEIKSFLILKNKLLKIVISNSSVFQNESNRSDTRRHRREGGEEEAAFRKSSILGRRDEPVFQCSSSSSSSVSVSRAAGGALWPRARSYVTDFFPSDMGNLSARELFAYISRGSREIRVSRTVKWRGERHRIIKCWNYAWHEAIELIESGRVCDIRIRRRMCRNTMAKERKAWSPRKRRELWDGSGDSVIYSLRARGWKMSTRADVAA